MSYSFSVKASTKDEAKQKVVAEFDGIIQNQPSHSADRAAAQTAIESFVDVLADPKEDQEVYVVVYGSLSWYDEGKFSGASVNINATLVTKS